MANRKLETMLANDEEGLEEENETIGDDEEIDDGTEEKEENEY